MSVKYIKSVLWRVAKCLSYIEEARCLKVKARIKRANGIFVELHALCENKNTLMKTKIRIFSINVKSVLFYGCGTWKMITNNK